MGLVKMTEKPMNTRKSVYEMTLREKETFVQAILKLKYTPSPISGNTWDTYVKWHQEAWFFNPIPAEGEGNGSYLSYSHFCPAFYPWHRQYLRLLELDLQAISGDASLSIPYWDWAMDQALLHHPNPKKRKKPEDLPIWDAGFMGGNGDSKDDWRVAYGPFSYKLGRWSLIIRTPMDFDSTQPRDSFLRAEPDQDLRRQFGGGYIDTELELPSLEEVQSVLKTVPYDSPPWNGEKQSVGFRKASEGLHGRGHMWVGWSMSPWTSPNDPSFFLHHSNVDRLWAKWQDLHPDLPYLPQEPIPEFPGQSIDEIMIPFGVPVSSVLNYREMGYQYDGKALDDRHPMPDAEIPIDGTHPGHHGHGTHSGHHDAISTRPEEAIRAKFLLD